MPVDIVAAVINVVAVDLAVPGFGLVAIYGMVHDAVFKMSAVYRNGRGNSRDGCNVNEEFTKRFPMNKVEEKRS